MTRSRYPGTLPFDDTEADRARFFGRRREVEQLYLRVLSVPLLVQFGRSGLGKTSLLQAGLFPRLREKPYLPVMIRFNVIGESLEAAVLRSLREACEAEELEFTPEETSGVWEILSSTTIWSGDLLLTPVLVFDQFEEVFTLRDPSFRVQLAAELGALASGKPPMRGNRPAAGVAPRVKIVISLREDYVGALEEFSHALPGLFHERLRLEEISEENAIEAIVEPARLVARVNEEPFFSPRFEFDPPALQLMLAELRGRSGVVEPFQLQLLCSHAESIAARRKAATEPVVLKVDDFRGAQRFSVVLDNFYRETINKLPARERKKAQRLCEDGLLDAGNHRLPLTWSQIESTYKLQRESLQLLCDARLIRSERRLDSTFYEISHDRIAQSIAEGRTYRWPKWLRVSFAVGLPLLVGAILFLAFWNRTISREREEARTARNSAEKLLTFLLGETFLGEIRDTGRTEMLRLVRDEVGDSAGRTPLNHALALRHAASVARNDNNLPASLKGHQDALRIFQRLGNRRESARSNDNIANVLLQQGEIAQSLKYYDAAVADWRAVIRADGGVDECVELAKTITGRANVQVRTGRSEQIAADVKEALGIASEVLFGGPGPCALRTDDLGPHPNVGAVAVLAEAAAIRGLVSGGSEDAISAAALGQYRATLHPHSSEARQQAMYGLVPRAHQAPTLNEALEAYRALATRADELWRWDPQNRQWSRDRAATRLLVAEIVARCHNQQNCDPMPSLINAEAMVLESLATMRTLAGGDSTNLVWYDDVTWALRVHSETLTAADRDGEALASAREALQRQRARRRDAVDKGAVLDIGGALYNLAVTEASAGNSAAAMRAIRETNDVYRRLVREHPRNVDFLANLENGLREQQVIDPADAAAAAEQQQVERTRAALRANEDAAIAANVRRDDQHYGRGQELFQARDASGALAEYELSEAAARQYLLLRPSAYTTYESLRAVYSAMVQALAARRDDGEVPALAAAQNAAALAAALAGPDTRELAEFNLIKARFALLEQTANRPDALPLAQELVASAEQLVEKSDRREYLIWLGGAKCWLGLTRRRAGAGGWEEALQSGFVHVQAAVDADPPVGAYLRELGFWHRHVAGELADRPREAAQHRAKALAAYRRALELDPNDAEAQAAIAEIENAGGTG